MAFQSQLDGTDWGQPRQVQSLLVAQQPTGSLLEGLRDKKHDYLRCHALCPARPQFVSVSQKPLGHRACRKRIALLEPADSKHPQTRGF